VGFSLRREHEEQGDREDPAHPEEHLPGRAAR
jgi:hypothetical protein